MICIVSNQKTQNKHILGIYRKPFHTGQNESHKSTFVRSYLISDNALYLNFLLPLLFYPKISGPCKTKPNRNFQSVSTSAVNVFPATKIFQSTIGMRDRKMNTNLFPKNILALLFEFDLSTLFEVEKK